MDYPLGVLIANELSNIEEVDFSYLDKLAKSAIKDKKQIKKISKTPNVEFNLDSDIPSITVKHKGPSLDKIVKVSSIANFDGSDFSRAKGTLKKIGVGSAIAAAVVGGGVSGVNYLSAPERMIEYTNRYNNSQFAQTIDNELLSGVVGKILNKNSKVKSTEKSPTKSGKIPSTVSILVNSAKQQVKNLKESKASLKEDKRVTNLVDTVEHLKDLKNDSRIAGVVNAVEQLEGSEKSKPSTREVEGLKYSSTKLPGSGSKKV